MYWNDENLPQLGRIFLRKVLENMRYENATVKFGTQGKKGVQPNYQITYPNDWVRRINGKSHDNWKDKSSGKDKNNNDEFNIDHLSNAFSYSQIKAAFDRAILL